MVIYSVGGGGVIWSPADFVCLPTDKEIIMVSLFEQWETITTKKCISKKL